MKTRKKQKVELSAAGVLASTTRNVYGIYDMSGGAYEYIMGMYQDADGNIHTGESTLSNSGFKGYLNDGM